MSPCREIGAQSKRSVVPLDRKMHVRGGISFLWREVKVIGALATTKIQSAFKRILAKVKPQNFNALEVTGITPKRFLGVLRISPFLHTHAISNRAAIWVVHANGGHTVLGGPEAERISQLAVPWHCPKIQEKP